jgi:hypothetical protein
MLVLILRSAHAQALPQSRKGLRASRRMRAATVRGPSCFETHRSATELGKHPYSFRAAMLLSMRARGAAYFRRTNPRPFWPSGSSPRRAPIRWLWVPALAARPGRTIAWSAKHQPAAVGNDCRLGVPVSGLFFTGNGATPTCRAVSARRIPTMPGQCRLTRSRGWPAGRFGQRSQAA